MDDQTQDKLARAGRDWPEDVVARALIGHDPHLALLDALEDDLAVQAAPGNRKARRAAAARKPRTRFASSA